MKRGFTFPILKFLIFTILFTAMQSCSKDAENDLMAENTRLSQTELTTLLATDQWTGAMDDVLMDLFEKHASVSAKFANADCYEVTYTDSGFRAVFRNCLLNTTDKVNGVLEVTFSSAPGVKSFTAVFTDFFVGGSQLNGDRTITVSQSGETDLALMIQSDMTVLLEDGTVLSENGTKNLVIQVGESIAGTTYMLSGDWTVTLGDTVYRVSADQPLTGNFQCTYLVSGLLDIRKNGLEIRVDFGDGSCDNRVTLIYSDGATEDLEL